MLTKIKLYIFWFVAFQTEKSTYSSRVTLENNGYQGLLIAINPEVRQDKNLIEAIKDIWTEASQALYVATKQRAYFEQVSILVPSTWTSYYDAVANKETYESADVLVAHPHPHHQHRPYTLQYGGCGEPATYIHLTPSYIKEYIYNGKLEPKGKDIVHQWAHYRWGVFDESHSEGYKRFYLSSSGDVEATRCPISITGRNLVMEYSSGSVDLCEIKPQTGLPEAKCIFLPHIEQLTKFSASIMSYQRLKQVETFCHNNDSDALNLHNKEAPNEHNRLCNLRSTSEVILNSHDFINNRNPVNKKDLATKPNFRVVRAESSRRFVLVLDVSNSMSGTRLIQMKQVVGTFISQFLPDEDRIAIVKFNTVSEILSQLTTLRTLADRNTLLDVIAAKVNIGNFFYGGTCIGCGLKKALEVLENNGESAIGGNIIVFTDGEETLGPDVNRVKSKIIEQGAVVHAVFFATDAKSNLQQLAIYTGGIWFFGSDTSTVNILGAFKSLAAPSDGDDFKEAFQIHSASFEVSKHHSISDSVIIDSSIGKNTTLSFAWSRSDKAIGVDIEAPTGCIYSTDPSHPNLCEDYTAPGINSRLKAITFAIPGTAQTGIWTYTVSSMDRSESVTVIATSMAGSQSAKPIVVKSGLKETEVGTGQPMIIYAKVSQGFYPILNADVRANIGRPDGSVIKIKLYDKGAAPDVRKADGVYSRYFTEYNEPGSYAVNIDISKDEDTSSNTSSTTPPTKEHLFHDEGTVDFNGKVSLPPTEKPHKKPQENLPINEKFSRVTSTPGFEYRGKRATATSDYFPPSTVIDLKAFQTNISDSSSGITLKFTAPGSDYDFGKATSYEIRYIVGGSTQLRDNFESCSLVLSSHFIEGSLSNPLQAGSIENFVLKPLELNETNLIKLGFAVRARDENNNVAEPSNVALVTYFYEFPRAASQDGINKYILPIIITLSTIILIVLIAVVIEIVKRRKKSKNKQREENEAATSLNSVSQEEPTTKFFRGGGFDFRN